MPQSHSFATPEPVVVDVRNPTGTIEVTATTTATASVEVLPLEDGPEALRLAEDRTRVVWSADGRRLSVDVPGRRRRSGPLTAQPAIAVRITVPLDSSVFTKAGSADLSCTGRLARIRAHSASGAIGATQVTGETRTHSASGALTVAETGTLAVHANSGATRVSRVGGDATVHTATGPVEIGVAAGSVRVHAGSADVTLAEVGAGSVDVLVGSGAVRIGVRPGAVARLDLVSGGRIGTDLPVEPNEPAGGSALSVRVRAGSGGVWVGSAAGVAAH